MTANGSVGKDGQHWESVHVCPNCVHIINFAELDPRAITMGIATCPSCDCLGKSRNRLQYPASVNTL